MNNSVAQVEKQKVTMDKLRSFVSWINDGIHSPSTNVANTFSYASCVAEAFQKQYGVQSHDHDNVVNLRASQLGKPAIVQAIEKLGYKIGNGGVTNKLRGIFHTGEVFECFIVEMLKLYGFKVSHSQHEIEFMGVKGHLDGVLDDSILLEVKTMSAQYASKFKKAPDDSRGYLTQLAVYTHAMQIPGVWLYYDKGTSTVGIVEFPEKRRDEVLVRAASLVAAMRQVQKLDDVFDFFSAPEPERYKCRNKLTERYVVPEALKYHALRHALYTISVEKDCYGKEREFVVDFNDPDTVMRTIHELKEQATLAIEDIEEIVEAA